MRRPSLISHRFERPVLRNELRARPNKLAVRLYIVRHLKHPHDFDERSIRLHSQEVISRTIDNAPVRPIQTGQIVIYEYRRNKLVYIRYSRTIVSLQHS